MKIKEVSSRTGLTEKAIRLYIENGLIHPHVEAGIYRNSYTFSEDDVRELEEISVFRKVGFSIFEISLIKEMPEKLPELLEKKMMSIEMEIAERKDIKEALSRLEVHELANASQVAKTLKPTIKKDELLKETVPKRFFYIIVTILIISIFFIYLYFSSGIFFVKIISAFLCFLISLISCVMIYRYAACKKRANKLPNNGKGTIISLVEEHGFNASFSNAGSGSAGTKEPGIGGIWQIFFMLWNEIRPDCWYPVILYKNGEQKESSTLPYGSFKNTWCVGEEIDISWNPTEPMIVYPLNKNWISKKIYFYAFITISAFISFIFILNI